ncbi:SRPBCC family protein [Chitinophaga filiformis]|uniref:type II toxin-antitoxin system RatA family toxin n=1 Tax=Chitinophaga filiformis TaxID=104663 RepID=UPI001F236A87|nr:SRPBCC family protein [Chitinophaga filiformis]MCF6401443.1 SRPBCC family protein [Chitinophaga filiformis]
METVKFAESIIINGSSEHVFDFTQDYNRRLEWDTFLKTAKLLNGAVVPDKGVAAYCVAKNGLGMVTEYITYNRPKVTAIKMTEGPFMFKSFLGSWTFKKVAVDKTEVIFLYSFSLRFPFSMLTKCIGHNLRTNVKKRLVDLKMNIENESMKA